MLQALPNIPRRPGLSDCQYLAELLHEVFAVVAADEEVTKGKDFELYKSTDGRMVFQAEHPSGLKVPHFICYLRRFGTTFPSNAVALWPADNATVLARRLSIELARLEGYAAAMPSGLSPLPILEEAKPVTPGTWGALKFRAFEPPINLLPPDKWGPSQLHDVPASVGAAKIPSIVDQFHALTGEIGQELKRRLAKHWVIPDNEQLLIALLDEAACKQNERNLCVVIDRTLCDCGAVNAVAPPWSHKHTCNAVVLPAAAQECGPACEGAHVNTAPACDCGAKGDEQHFQFCPAFRA